MKRLHKPEEILKLDAFNECAGTGNGLRYLTHSNDILGGINDTLMLFLFIFHIQLQQKIIKVHW